MKAIVPSTPILYCAHAVQFALALGNGWMSTHPFGSVNSTTLMTFTGLSIYLAFKNKVAPHRSETLVSWQAYNAVAHLAHCLAMTMIVIYSKGSCDSLVEKCDNNSSSIAAIVTLGINSLISLGLYVLLGRAQDERYPKRTMFKTVYIFLIVFGCIAYLSGLCAIDGTNSFLIALGIMCYLGGASTLLVLIYRIRSRLAFPILLAFQWVISVAILVGGFFTTEIIQITTTDGSGEVIQEDVEQTVMRNEVVTTQVISMLNLCFGTLLMFLNYFLKWEYEKQDPVLSNSSTRNSFVMEDAPFYPATAGPKNPKDTSTTVSLSDDTVLREFA